MNIKPKIDFTHPFPFIDELKYIKEIKNFNDIIKIRDIVYSLVPWTEENQDLTDLREIYPKLKKREFGGWCSFHAKVFKEILQGYKVPCEIFNFGLHGYGITHVANIVTYLAKDYFLDSYFAKHYVDNEGYILELKDLMELIQMRRFEDIHASYSSVEKSLQQEGGWVNVCPIDFEKNILTFFESKNMDKILRKIFGGNDFRLLMLVQIPPNVKKEDFYYGEL